MLFKLNILTHIVVFDSFEINIQLSDLQPQ